ncbi:hypothetical protein [Catenulispora rubra]|uniref:hypothetical protein n=1 Tax=Catenulispora rubra TaxID=280293 RepID=UPI00189250F1|nr:hypothetical protein [Catenulispora rubra]
MTEGSSAGPQSVKTLGVALPDDLHSQFALVAGLEGLSLKDAVLAAVREYISSRREALAEKATQALADIEKEAALKRDALQSLFGTTASAEAPKSDADAAKPTTRRKAE